MRVLVTGATGVIGRAAVRALLGAGHAVTGVARSDGAAAAVAAAGAAPVAVDLFDARAVRTALDGHDAVAHLATCVPPLGRMARPGAWSTHNRLRVDATRNLCEAARDVGVRRIVKESVTFVYRDGGERLLDEDAPVDAAPAWRPTLDGERIAAGSGPDAVVLRFGLLYDADARSTAEYRRLARVRIAPVPGPPGAYVSSIHAADAGAAVAAALAVPAGTYNVVDDRPVTRREYARAFAAAAGAPRLRPVPGALVRLVGGSGARGLVASQRVSNRRFRAASPWRPTHADVVAGWRWVLEGRAA